MGLFGNGHAATPGPADDDPPGPPDLLRAYLALAIQIGAPAYNGGDRRGCFEVYACTARMLLRSIEAMTPEKTQLRAALEACAVEVDVDQQAWIMRRAFDAILGEGSD